MEPFKLKDMTFGGYAPGEFKRTQAEIVVREKGALRMSPRRYNREVQKAKQQAAKNHEWLRR